MTASSKRLRRMSYLPHRRPSQNQLDLFQLSTYCVAEFGECLHEIMWRKLGQPESFGIWLFDLPDYTFDHAIESASSSSADASKEFNRAHFFFEKTALSFEPWISTWQSMQVCRFAVRSCAWTRDSSREEIGGGK